MLRHASNLANLACTLPSAPPRPVKRIMRHAFTRRWQMMECCNWPCLLADHRRPLPGPRRGPQLRANMCVTIGLSHVRHCIKQDGYAPNSVSKELDLAGQAPAGNAWKKLEALPPTASSGYDKAIQTTCTAMQFAQARVWSVEGQRGQTMPVQHS